MEKFIQWLSVVLAAYSMGYIKGYDTGNSFECATYVQESSYQK